MSFREMYAMRDNTNGYNYDVLSLHSNQGLESNWKHSSWYLQCANDTPLVGNWAPQVQMKIKVERIVQEITL